MDAAEWHARSGEAALQTLESSPSGLSAEEARARLGRHGPNRLPQAAGPSAIGLLLAQVRSPLIYALLLSAAVAAAFGELEDAAVVLAVVVLNALIGFVQEYRAGRAIAALAELVAEPALVRRDDAWVEVPAELVVPGDVMSVAQGDRVSADVRLLHAERLRTQEAVLTGESAPVDKQPAAAPPEAPLAERRSMLHAGTVVAAGTGLGVAVATGIGDRAGADLGAARRGRPVADAADARAGPPRAGRSRRVIGVAAVLLAIVAVVRGFPLADAALAGISLAVAAVPEGLPAVVTIALAIGVRRMARRRAIIRHLPAVETLGSTTVVASDKTGTLTRNQMTVQAAWTPGAGDDVRELLLAGVLCNDASLARGSGDDVGDPTETALLEYAASRGLDVDAARADHPRLEALPFDSERKLMATLHQARGGGTAVYVKGAPEVVLPLCADAAASGAAAQVERLADQGQRVLVFAAGKGRATSLAEPLGGLRLLGLQAMIDPPREAALDAVTASRAAGVRVMMITGDHPRTALAIGRALGLTGGPAVTGPELEAADERVAPRACPGCRRLRACRARAQAAPRSRAAGAGRGGGDDGRRRQRCSRAAAGGYRRGHGTQRQRRGQGGGRHGARRR